MGTKTLIEKIEALPADKKAELENFVELLATRSKAPSPTPRFPRELLEEINALRERLHREHGLFADSTPFIRELRETGR